MRGVRLPGLMWRLGHTKFLGEITPACVTRDVQEIHFAHVEHIIQVQFEMLLK